MINFGVNNLPQECRVFLCKPNDDVICELNGVEPSGASLKINLNDQNEIEFDYFRYIEDSGEIIESNGYNQFVTGMRLFVENLGYFILRHPPYTYDGDKEYKHISAYSAESELEDKDLVSFKINTGEKNSCEYLVEYEHSPYYTVDEIESMSLNDYELMNGLVTDRPDYETFYNFLQNHFTSSTARRYMQTNPFYYIGNNNDGYIHLRYIYSEQKSIVIGETEDLINPYTKNLYDYIVFYNTFPEQLTKLKKKYSSFIIVDELPTSNISTDSCYLIATETTNVYSRYFYEDGQWHTLPNITYIIETVSDITTVKTIISYPDDIEEIINYCSLIPRLEKKTNRDLVTKEIISVTQYIIKNYVNGELTITLENIETRFNELITFYTKYRSQLSLIDLALSNSNTLWSVGDIDESLVNIRCQFDIDGQNIYSFLTQDIALQSKCIAQFDCVNYRINYVAINDLGEDSKVIIDKRNLINNLNISATEDKLTTRYNVSGGNDLNIMDVNFGTNRIVNINYYLNAKDENDNRIYLSDELAEKYEAYKSDIEKARIVYINKTKQSRQLQKDIDELNLRVPNDEVKNDWGTFTQEELEAALITYNDLLNTLKSMYREDFPNGVDGNDSIYDYFVGLQLPVTKNGEVGVDYYIIENNGYNHYIFSNGEYISQDYSAPPQNTITIRNTFYWHDYFAYKEAITQIEFALLALANNTTYKEVTPDTPLYDEGGHQYSKAQIEQMLKNISAWETDWSLYGIKELQSKINIYNNIMNTLVSNKAVLVDSDGKSLSYSQASSIEKYESEAVYNSAKDEYDLAKEERDSCQSYLNSLKDEVESKEEDYKDLETELKQIKILVTIDTYSRSDLHDYVPDVPDESLSFTSIEVKIINKLYFDSNYSNDNILKTSLEDIVSVIDIEKELLDDAVEQLSIVSQPQYTLTANIDNLMALKEFEGYEFRVGNFAYLEYYDEYYIKLRLNTIEFNPFAPEETLSITFTNYIKSNSERSDLSFILKENSASGGSSGGGSGSGSGEFGTSDKIDVTISNTMLAKLLNTEMFASRVSDVILDSLKVNNLNVRYATFGSLAGGQTIIDGACIQTGSIKSYNYDDGTEQGHTAAGSILNLNDGTFSFAGGKLTYNTVNGLIINGIITAGSGSSIGGWNITDEKIYYNGTRTAVMQRPSNSPSSLYVFAAGGYSDSSYDDCPFRVTKYGKLYATDAVIGTSGTISSSINTSINIIDGRLYSDSMPLSDSWDYKHDGITETLYATTRISIDDGNISCTGVYTSAAKFWEEDANYWVTLNGLEFDMSRLDTTDQTYTTKFRINLRTGEQELYCDLLSKFTKIVYFQNSVYFDIGSGFRAYYSDNTSIQDFVLAPVSQTGTSSGDGYIGTNQYRWHSIYCHDGAFNGSDKKLKNHIKYLSDDENVVRFIKDLKPVMYTFKNGEGHRHHMGLYAQDVSDSAYKTIGDIAAYQAVTISQDDNGNIIESYYDKDADDNNLSWVMNYNELLAPTIATLQIALNKIDKLQDEINELKGE